MKNFFLWIVVFICLLLVGCEQQSEEPVIEEREAAATAEIPPPAVDETDNDAVETPDPPPAPETAAAPEVFVPITVEDFGLSTVVPADWPKIEDDPLLKNAWGPGEFRFVAFHSVPGALARPAMAQLLGIDAQELVDNPPEGEYWEEQIGAYNWSLYNVDSPEIGLGQSVAMTVQDGTVYIVSLFIEMDYREAVLNAVLENFSIESAAAGDGSVVVDYGKGEGGVGETGDITEFDLVDTNWTLVRLDDGSGQLQELLPETEITAVFNTEGRVSGSAGCNSYASLYTIDGDALSITLPAMTRMVCDAPEDIMLQETSFLNSLTAVAAYHIDGNGLQLLDVGGNDVLVFNSP